MRFLLSERGCGFSQVDASGPARNAEGMLNAEVRLALLACLAEPPAAASSPCARRRPPTEQRCNPQRRRTVVGHAALRGTRRAIRRRHGTAVLEHVSGGRCRDCVLVPQTSSSRRPADYSLVVERPLQALAAAAVCRAGGSPAGQPEHCDMVAGHVRWSKGEEISLRISAAPQDAVRPI